MADLRIDLAAEFRGKKAFKEADKATTNLDKAVGKLGKQIASVFAISTIAAFGKASIKAFGEDEAAAIRLANVLENLGLAFATAENEKFIASLEASSNILDDLLRPALQKLITTTGSLTYSQDLLTKATEIANGSGRDLVSVVNDLALAYVGNTRGLMKYGLGLTKAELAAMSFEQIMAALNNQFSGSNAAYLDTYAGKMNALTVASENAKEVIGKGLLDAFSILAGGADANITTVTEAIGKLADGIANVIRGTAYYVEKLLSNPVIQALLKAAAWLAKNTGALSLIPKVAAKGKSLQVEENAPKMTASQKALLESQKKQAEANAKIVKSQKAATAEAKKQAALKKAGSIFDLEQIQLIAALKGKLSDEDRKRVELQFALITGNTKEAQALTFELAKAQGLTDAVARNLASLPDAKNPFAAWEAYLDMLMEKVRKVTSATPSSNTSSTAASSNTVASYTGTPFGQAGSFVDTMGTPFGQAGSYRDSVGTPFGQAGSIVVQIDGKAVASALQDSSLSGIGSSVNRTGR
jgi:hypothetical protein